MADRPVVLLVGKGPPELGGIPSFLVALTESALADRFDLRFLNLTPVGGSQGGRLSVGNLASTVADAVRVAGAARAADVVHLHSALFPGVTLLRGGLLALAGRLAGAPVLVHAHGGRLDQWLTTGRRRRTARAALRPATEIVAVSRPNQRALEAAIGRPVALVLNGIDTGRFRPRVEVDDSHPPRVVYAGVLAPRKGLYELFDASRRLIADGVDHELVLAGGASADGASGAEEAAALRAAAPPWAHFLGALGSGEVADVYAGADVFCLPSHGDAMPLAVLEAMGTGLPVVATTVGQVGEMVDDGVTGLLVAPRDVDALTAALRSVLVDRGRRAALGAAGRARVERDFDLRATVDDVAARYDRLAAMGRRRRHRLSR